TATGQAAARFDHGGAEARRACPRHRSLGGREVDAVPRARRDLALLEGPHQAAERRAAAVPAAEALPAGRLAEACGLLSERCGHLSRRRSEGSAARGRSRISRERPRAQRELGAGPVGRRAAAARLRARSAQPARLAVPRRGDGVAAGGGPGRALPVIARAPAQHDPGFHRPPRGPGAVSPEAPRLARRRSTCRLATYQATARRRGSPGLMPSAWRRDWPVWLALFAATCSGVPSATSRPPPSPP